jgi:hypothetical protein
MAFMGNRVALVDQIEELGVAVLDGEGLLAAVGCDPLSFQGKDTRA